MLRPRDPNDGAPMTKALKRRKTIAYDDIETPKSRPAHAAQSCEPPPSRNSTISSSYGLPDGAKLGLCLKLKPNQATDWNSSRMEKRATRRIALGEHFNDITVNGNGRPVRSILNEGGVDSILETSGRFKMDLVDAKVMKGLRSFGDDFDQANGKMVSRMRANMSVRQLNNFLSRFAEQNAGAVTSTEKLEANIIQQVLQFYPQGMSYQSDERPGYIYNRSYRPEDYRIIFAGLFIDPPGSSIQHTHSDVSMADRDALWNIAIPFAGEMNDPYVMAESRSGGHHRGGEPLRAGEACVWDGGWPHAGQGNPTKQRRVLLHLALAPYWMITLRTTKDGSFDFGKLDPVLCNDLLHFDKITPSVLHHLHGSTVASTKESRMVSGKKPLPHVRQRIMVYWDGDGAWYAGTVQHVAQNGNGSVNYDDGDTSKENFYKSRWQPVPARSSGVEEPHSSISKEYNNSFAIHDRRGAMISWVERASHILPLPSPERDAEDRGKRLEAAREHEQNLK